MTKFKHSVLISIILAIILTVISILIFIDGIFKFDNLKNFIYSLFFIIFYALAFFFIPFKILHFANSIQKSAQTLDFETGAGNTKNVFSKIFLNYKKTFLTEQDNILGANGKTRTNADLYFNADELCEASFLFPIFPMMKIIIGTFVGLGILGTFIGFSAAIPDGEITSAEDLNPLIEGLKTAFNTSIVGVFSSVFYNFLIVQPLIKLLNQNSKLLSDRLDEQYFVTDVASMEKMSTIVQETLTTVQSNTTELAEKFKDSTTEMFKEALSEGREELNREMSNAALKLSEITKIMDETPQAIKTLNEELNESILQSTQQTKLQLEIVVETINTSLNEKLQNFADELKPSTENLKSYAQKISEAAEKIETVPDKFNQLAESIKNAEVETSEKLKSEISEIFTDAEKSVSETYEMLEASVNKITESSTNAISSSYDKLASSVDKITNSASETVSSSYDLLKTLPEKINDVHNSFAKSEEELTGRIQDVASSLRDAISAMGSSYETILEAIRTTLNKIEKTKDEIDSLLEASKANNSEISTNLKSAIEQYGFIKDETKNMLSGYLQVDKSLASIFDQIKNQFENYSNGIGSALTKYMDGFANGTKDATAAFHSSVEELNIAFEDMQTMIENLHESEEKLDLLPEKIEKILSKKISQTNQMSQPSESGKNKK